MSNQKNTIDPEKIIENLEQIVLDLFYLIAPEKDGNGLIGNSSIVQIYPNCGV